MHFLNYDVVLKNLEIFFDSNDIVYNKRLIEIAISDIGGLGVFSLKQRIKSNTILGKISKASIISKRNSQIRNLINECNLKGTLALTLVVMFEFIYLKHSKWKIYLESLPFFEPLPFTWPRNLQKELTVTSIGNLLSI
ncbi:hypothetical protein HK099_003963 [Clydaea vesicula]|uniref:Uncharacterized protein n=1 Tax=Clydaea vesicula TaxID=447962 RepID=A0AAD5Y339_9FUNG|nr:hypothetical protein HK099_003963 [Clydaea vesicula]